MIDTLITNYCKDPWLFAGSSILIILCITACFIFIVKVLGDPLKDFFVGSGHLFKLALKEITGKAGATGVVDFCIVLLIFLLTIVIISKPTILQLFQSDDKEVFKYSVILIIFAIVAFIISLFKCADLEKFIIQSQYKVTTGNEMGTKIAETKEE